MSNGKHFKKRGDEYLLTAPGAIIMFFDAGFIDPESTDNGGSKARKAIDALIAEATRKGYPHGDILTTMICRDGITPRAVDGIERLASVIGHERAFEIIKEACQ